jgi:ribosome biogenesis GTPase
MNSEEALANLGWQPFFQQQLMHDEWDIVVPVRVVAQHRSEIIVSGNGGDRKLSILSSMPEIVVGDWLLLNEDRSFLRLLDRKTCFSRKSAGGQFKKQLLSANVDTAFIVSSLNEDFNLNRIERYLSLVYESGAFPVVILSKSDLVNEPRSYVTQVQALDSLLMVEAVNTLKVNEVEKLATWANAGDTIVVLGSSGVGKSSLINTLCNEDIQATSRIREADAKGRHTTTSRSLIRLRNGGLIIDTPGMREIQLAENKEGIAKAFADIECLSESCKFFDCQHTNEPECAVKQAIETGDLEERRLGNYLKLLREEKHNSASLVERRATDKALGKFYKKTLGESSKLKGRE